MYWLLDFADFKTIFADFESPNLSDGVGTLSYLKYVEEYSGNAQRYENDKEDNSG